MIAQLMVEKPKAKDDDQSVALKISVALCNMTSQTIQPGNDKNRVEAAGLCGSRP